jgi:hypothetical protein
MKSTLGLVDARANMGTPARSHNKQLATVGEDVDDAIL